MLSYARGIRDAWCQPGAASPAEPLPLQELLAVMQSAPSTVATFQAALDAAPRRAEIQEHAAAVGRITARYGDRPHAWDPAAAGCTAG